MPLFTIETTYRIPVYRQRRYEAPTLAEACRIAIEDDDWEGSKEDYECAGETYVSEVVSVTLEPYCVEPQQVPSQFGETIQRKADHFAELLAQLALVAQPMGLSAHDFARWLPSAQSAVRKANAIVAAARDPEE
jgi:hypothetical protein